MRRHDDTIYLQYILESITRIEEYLEGIDKATFDEVHLLQDGIIRQLQIIGEATSRISPGLSERYPDVPWSNIVGMRHKIVHDFFEIDLDVVWVTATERVPKLKEQLQQLLGELDAT